MKCRALGDARGICIAVTENDRYRDYGTGERGHTESEVESFRGTIREKDGVKYNTRDRY